MGYTAMGEAVVTQPTRIECPLCAGRGTSSGPARRRGQKKDLCRLCQGAGSVSREAISELIEQVQRLADAMQAGDPDRAAREGRRAARIARRWLV